MAGQVNIHDTDQVVVPTNKFQTPVTRQLMDVLPEEVQQQFMECLTDIEFVRNLINPNRPYPKDLEKDSMGRCIIDLSNPPIVENTDFFNETVRYYQKYGCYTFLKPNSNPNSEFGKFMKRELHRCWNGMLRKEDGIWIPGYMYWYLNYVPMMINVQEDESKNFSSRIEGFPRFWEGALWRFWYIDQARFGGMYNDFKGGQHGCELASRGKAFAYSQEVETPEGRMLWKDVHVGSKLFAPDGTITKVVAIPFDDEHDVYKMTFKDGRFVYTTLEHLWNMSKNGVHWDKLYSTKDIIDSKCINRFAIDVPKCVEYEYKDIPIDPYLLGLIIGDGSITISTYNTIQFSGTEDDVKSYELITNVKFKRVNEYDYNWLIHYDGFERIANSLGINKCVSYNKFIPKIYKYNSSSVRLNILRGLLDTDGTVHDGGKPEFSTSSKQLAEDVLWIARSLGYNASVSVKHPKYNLQGESKVGRDNYIVYIQAGPEVFNLERKKCLCKLNNNRSLSRYLRTSVQSVEYSHRERCKCVTVDRNDGMFLIGDFIPTHNSKSYGLTAIASHNLIIGESEMSHKRNICILAAYSKEYLQNEKDGTLNKIIPVLDHVALNTQFPRLKIVDSPNKMAWQMGYRDKTTNAIMGSRNTFAAVAVKDDSDKLRGKRGTIMFEEFGSMPGLKDVYSSVRDSVEEGGQAFAQIYLVGTSGNDEDDFSGAKELVTNPKGYKIYALPNVYSKKATVGQLISYFYPAYVNYGNCQNKDGISDVTKALLEILIDRYNIKYNSSDPGALIKRVAERCITPEEALIKVHSSIFPINDVNERKKDLMLNHGEVDKLLYGHFIIDSKGEVKFESGIGYPIREYPFKGADTTGAVEIKDMPCKDSNGNVFNNRYLGGLDPYDQDKATDSVSLGSWYILDTWTDELVAWYCGRPDTADEFYEQTRRAAIFYNAAFLFEQNKLGAFTYFRKMNSIKYLSGNLDSLKSKFNLKETYGNMKFGVNATKPINDYARDLIKYWLIKERVILDKDGNEVMSNNVKFIYDIGLLDELSLYDGFRNCDRISALGMLMLLYQDRVSVFGDDMGQHNNESSVESDQYFRDNYDDYSDTNELQKFIDSLK